MLYKKVVIKKRYSLYSFVVTFIFSNLVVRLIVSQFDLSRARKLYVIVLYTMCRFSLLTENFSRCFAQNGIESGRTTDRVRERARLRARIVEAVKREASSTLLHRVDESWCWNVSLAVRRVSASKSALPYATGRLARFPV